MERQKSIEEKYNSEQVKRISRIENTVSLKTFALE
jgi:hypothetical protein